ncbi:hypothetical protein HDU99_005037 [Rhizoclosmatium hyalinum]|nr:hypothetical protein HDU99_005037 [Rhizoclosmatium hyalinum]
MASKSLFAPSLMHSNDFVRIHFATEVERLDSHCIFPHQRIPKNKSITCLLSAACRKNIQVAKLLLKDPRIDLNNAGNLFAFVFEGGNHALVKLFLEDERINPSVNNNRALRIAARNNHAHVVSLLLQDPRVDPSDCWDVLCEAAEFCRTDIVRILLANPPRVDPSIHNNAAIRRALVRWEYNLKDDGIDVLKMLLSHPRVDPGANNSEVVRNMHAIGHLKAVKLLMEDGRVDTDPRGKHLVIIVDD